MTLLRSVGGVVVALLATTAAGCVGELGDPLGGSEPGSVETQGFEAAPVALRRLLARQYRSSIADLLGEGAALAADPPEDSSLNGFDAIAAAQLALGDAQVIRYEKSARAAAAAAMGDAARIDELLACTPAGITDDDCHQSFVERFGRLAFRRSLAADEVERYVGVARTAATELGDFHAGVEHAIAGMLQSPYFLYQVEIGEPDPQNPGQKVLTGLELATRMSFALLDTTPSEALLDMAEAGELDTEEGLRNAAESLLDQPKARAAVRAYFDEVLLLRELTTIVKDADLYAEFTPALAESMRGETLALIEHLAFETDASFLDLLDAPYTFVDAELATFYGLEPPEGSGYERVDLPSDLERGGLMGHAGLLASLSHTATTSVVLRGRFVREKILCESIPAPPMDVVTLLPPDSEAKTMKEKVAKHLSEPSCAACHKLMDPIGLGLEKFDAIGAYRTMDKGELIDSQAELEGIGAFDGPASLGALLKNEPKVASCFVKNYFRNATAHVETKGEMPAIRAIEEGFAASGYSFREMLVDLVASPAFRFAGESK